MLQTKKQDYGILTITYIISLIAAGLIVYYIAKNEKNKKNKTYSHDKLRSNTLRTLNNDKKLYKRQLPSLTYNEEILQETSCGEYIKKREHELPGSINIEWRCYSYGRVDPVKCFTYVTHNGRLWVGVIERTMDGNYFFVHIPPFKGVPHTEKFIDYMYGANSRTIKERAEVITTDLGKIMFKITTISLAERDEVCHKNHITLSEDERNIGNTYRLYLFQPFWTGEPYICMV